MSNEKYCPFWFAAPHHDEFYCIKSKCALWVEDVESSACGLAYEVLLMAKNRKRLANTRWLTAGEKIKVLDRDGDCDA